MRRSKRPKLSLSDDGTTENDGTLTDSGVELTISSPNDFYNLPLSGRIESLHMINFMCHKNIEMPFNKRITFITGKNGSGKSTIMAALIVVLGGTASTTGRGSGVADFIKTGETYAKVSVTLTNDGLNAYKKDVYGSRIIITRTLSKNSPGSYSCKSENGDVISRKKEEVDNITTALDLQIKNPICILNQDVARSFMSATDTKLRYSMFMKATHLENLKLIYSDTIDMLCSSQEQLKSKKLGIKEASTEIGKLKEKLEFFASLEESVKERKALENEYVWSMVMLKEKDLDELKKERAKIEKKREEIAQNESNFKSIINKLEDDVKNFEETLSRLRNGNSEEKQIKKELNSKIQNFQRQIDSANGQLKQLTTRKQRQEADIDSIKKFLQQDENLASQSQAEHEKNAEKMNKLSQELSELQDRIQTTQRDLDNGIETKVQHASKLEGLQADAKVLEKTKNQLEFQLQRTNSNESGNNSMLKYGPFTTMIKALIDEATRKNQFHKKPIGPCGLYVTLSGNSKWARAVESVIGGLMDTYCCDNQKDFQVLSHIMDRVCSGKHPPIIISKFHNTRHNVSSKKVSVRGFSSVLDVLEFSNDVVFNTFIDQSRLETILLFETDAQAASLLTHIQNVPKNLRMGLTLQSDQYFPAPNYRTYCGNSTRPLKYFDSAMKSKAILDGITSELEKTRSLIKEKNMEIADLTNKLMRATEFSKKSENNLRLLKQSERKIQSEITKLKDEEEIRPVLPRRVALEEELSVLEKSQEELLEKISKNSENLDALTSQKNDVVKELEKVTENENKFRREIFELEERFEESKIKLSEIKDKKKNASGKLKETETELDKIAEKVTSASRSLASQVKEASMIHKERIDTERSPVEIRKLLEKCQRYLQVAEKMHNREEVINEYKLKQKKFKVMKETSESLESYVQALAHAANCKRERFGLMQRNTAHLVSLHFQACLKTRGYDGQLKFDFKNQILDLEVIPKDGLARKDVKTLSGGERSYSMVSFILAIWRAVQVPFYFLDEFDVFMDKVNRKFIMDLLLEHARNQDKMQFVFITPQDISSISTSDIVSIYEMPNPREEKK